MKNISVWFDYYSPDQWHGNGTEQIFFNFTKNKRLRNYDYYFEMLNETLLFDLPPKESPITCGVDRFAIASVVLGIVVVAVGIFASCAGYSMAIAWNMLTFL